MINRDKMKFVYVVLDIAQYSTLTKICNKGRDSCDYIRLRPSLISVRPSSLSRGLTLKSSCRAISSSSKSTSSPIWLPPARSLVALLTLLNEDPLVLLDRRGRPGALTKPAKLTTLPLAPAPLPLPLPDSGVLSGTR